MGNEQEYITGMLARTLLFFSTEDVEKIRNTIFAIAGFGGVGAITAELLARWGVKHFRFLDMDTYEPSNLNRQLFATAGTLGQAKVEVAAARIKEINPYAEIEIRIRERVNNENVQAFVKGAGMVIQNADYPSAKLFYLAAREHRVPLINGYAKVTGGRVQAFDYRHSACSNFLDGWWQRLKFGNQKPLTERNPEEIAEFDREYVHPTAPSLNFVTNMVGCLIVAEAVKLLTGRGKPVAYPYYLAFDLFRGHFKLRHSGSPFNPDNLKRVISLTGSHISRRLAKTRR